MASKRFLFFFVWKFNKNKVFFVFFEISIFGRYESICTYVIWMEQTVQFSKSC